MNISISDWFDNTKIFIQNLKISNEKTPDKSQQENQDVGLIMDSFYCCYFNTIF